MKNKEQDYFQIITETLQDAIIIIDHKGEITFWNASAEKILGYLRNEILGRNLHEVIVPKSYHKSYDAGFSEFFRTGKGSVVNKTVEVEAIHREGRIIQVELSISGLKQGENWHALGILRDITERKEKEAMLLESEARFRLMADTTPVLIWSSGTDALCDYFNLAWLSFTGRTMDQELGNGWVDGVHPDDKKRCFEIYLNSFRNRSAFKMEYRLKNADGRYHWLLDNGSPRLTNEGAFLGFIGSCIDISDRKEKELKIYFQNDEMAKNAAELVIANKELHYQNDEKAKRAAELIILNELVAFERDHLQKIASLVPGVLYQLRLRPDGSFCLPYVSEAFKELYRLTPEEVREDASKAFANIHPNDHDEVVTSILQSAKDLSPWKHDYRIIFDDGTIRFLFGNSIPLLLPDGSVLWHGFITDITERKDKERKIESQNNELQRLISEKDKFFSIIAHDLRGPMAGIMQLAKLLANEEQSHSDSVIREMKLNISHQASNTFNLLENMLEWSQLNRGNFNFNPQNINLNKVVQECANFHAEQIRSKEIELVIGIPNNKEVIADKTMFNIVIRNLLSNAIKFTRKGGLVTISVNEAANNQTMISVKDTGIGMTEELKNNLFRIDANTRRRGTQGESSTGLGLQLCKEFVEIQGGKMSINSQQYVGSVFSFTIPSADPLQKINETVTVEPSEIGKGALKLLNVLIVEDDDITYSLLKIVVRKVSKEFYRAFSGTEAVEFCLQHPELDLILMDLRLPVLNGLEATQQIRLFNKDVVIIAQTAQASDYDRNMVLDAGCDDFISKPYNIKKLMEMITEHFNK